MNIQGYKNIEMQRPVSSSQGYLICRNPKKSRRFRSAFTTEQVQYLEEEFKKCPYIGNTNRREISNALNISERAIKIWFQNRRMKGKKEAIREVNNVNQNKITFNLSNDQLNNVNNLQSTNDEARITTSLKVTNEDSNVNQGITHGFDTGALSRKQVFQPLVNNVYEHEISTTSADNIPKNLSKQFEDHKIKGNQMSDQRISNNKKETAMGSNIGNNQIQYHLQMHDLPQDLSQRSKEANISEVKLNAGNVSRDTETTSVYFQNCYTPPCISSNVLWKPFNMNPMLPGVTAVQNPYNPGSFALYNPNLRKSNCNCDCHQLTPHVIQNSSQTQYIPLFTIPFPRPDMS